MQTVTLAITAIFSLLALTLPPAYALAAYVTCLLWYPTFLVLTIGTIDMPVSRIVVGVLLLRCLCDGRIRSRFTWSRLDTWVALSMLVYCGAALSASDTPLSETLESQGGILMNTWFAYMVTRFIVTDRARLISIVKCISLALVPLAILGVFECVTGRYQFALLWRFSPWFMGGGVVPSPRFGLSRAVGPFSHSILFGCGFALFLPLIYYLRHEKDHWHSLAYVLFAVAVVGALSSMSSGPWVMVIAVIFCLTVQRYKHWLKPLLIFFVFSCIFIAIASNRPFYHVVASFANPLGGAGWHRAKVIDLAIEHFDEWWLDGYGGKDPGWGPELGMVRTDVTNEFIAAAVRYGVFGVIALCIVLTKAFRGIFYTYRITTDPYLKSLYWSLGSALSSATVAWMSVTFFGQLKPLFYCLLGIIGSSFYFVGHHETGQRSLITNQSDIILAQGQLKSL